LSMIDHYIYIQFVPTYLGARICKWHVNGEYGVILFLVFVVQCNCIIYKEDYNRMDVLVIKSLSICFHTI